MSKVRGGKNRVMNNDVWLLRESIVKITQMLTGKGLMVTQRGVSASVKTDSTGKPVAINLPYVPDNATEELCSAIQGFLDKEVSTVLFTDFTELKKVEKNKPLYDMAKLIEDARVEKEMAKQFRGSASNCAFTSQFFLDKYTTPKLTEATVGGDDNAAIALMMHPLIRSMCGLRTETDYMSGKESIVEEVTDKISVMASKLEANTSTKSSIELAREVRKLLSDEDEDEDGDGEDSDGKGKGGKGAAGVGADDGDGDGDGDGEDGAGNREDLDWDNKAGGGGKIGNSSPLLGAIDKENANSFDKTMSEIISEETTDVAKHAQYLVYTKDSDVIEPLHVGSGYKPSMFTEHVEDPVQHMVGPLQKDLERAISARSMSVWENGRRSGRLHSANLTRMAVGDDRVFRRKHESRSKDVAVELVIDCSGSMSGSKITLATQAAYALSSVLERIRISHEVICFTTGDIAGGDHEEMRKEEVKLGRAFTRRESLYMPILKSFNERLGVDVKSRFGWLPNCRIMAANVDGESIEIAARRLMARSETGKIMIVLSDGYPAASGDSGRLNTHLKEVVLQTTKLGVNVIGIGIQSDAVQKFYPKHVVINNVKELPATVIKELRALLIKD